MFKKINNVTCFKNEPLSNFCTFQIGGNAKYVVLAYNIDALLDTINTCLQHNMKYKIIGSGSNILFDDLGYNGTIIKYVDSYKKLADNALYTSSGNHLSDLIQYTSSNNLSGLEFAIGVPAQLGGAIINNLGAYNHNIGSLIQYVTVLRGKHIVYLTQDECGFAYHKSSLQYGEDIVLSAIIHLNPSNKAQILSDTKQFFAKRTSTQPLHYANAGSIFRRMDNIIPAKLIDELQLKGTRVGGAQISTKHAGFIVNLGEATSKDVLQLINIIQFKIYQKYNISLELEIEYLPF